MNDASCEEGDASEARLAASAVSGHTPPAGPQWLRGLWGDPTPASRSKGERVVEAMLQGILADIEGLRGAPLPEREPSPL